MKFRILILLLIVTWVYACDSGDIYPETNTVEKRVVEADFKISDIGAFPRSENYQLVFASFKDDVQYPLNYKLLPVPEQESAVLPVKLINIPDDADYVALSLLNKSRRIVHHFFKHSVADLGDQVLSLPEENIKMISYNRLQQQLFNLKCVACHGGANFTAAGLNLTESRSYGKLVNVSSTVEDSKLRVHPGMPSKSFLLEILMDRDAAGTDHTEMVDSDDVNLVKLWIEAGSLE